MNRDRRRMRGPLLVVVLGLLGTTYFSLSSNFSHPSILDRDEVRGVCVGACLGLELLGGYYLLKLKRACGTTP